MSASRRSVSSSSSSSSVAPSTTPPVTEPAPGDAEAALAQAQAELEALTEDSLLVVNVDVPVVCTRVLAVLPGLRACQPQFYSLPDFDRRKYDGLRTYTLAVLMAHARYVHSREERPAPTALAQRCSDTLDVLLRAGHALSDAGLLPAEPLQTYRKQPGYRPLAVDTLALVAQLRERWTAISARTALTRAQLDAADLDARKLLEALGERDAFEREASRATVLRQRAFTLFARAYEEVRRGALYLRWYHGDADKLAPSLYAGRTGKPSQDAADPATPAAPASPTTPAAPADATPASTLRAMSGDPSTAPHLADAVPASPFTTPV